MTQRVSDFDPLEVPPGTSQQVVWVFERFSDESHISIPIYVIGGERPGRTALIVAGIHGDEYEGPAALFRLMRDLTPSRVNGRLIIVPVANIEAWRAGTRVTPIDGVNLARVFPGSPDAGYTERLAHHLFQKVVMRADFLMDCHSGGVNTIFLPVAGYYEESGDIADMLAEASLAMAQGAGLPHIWRLPPRAGVLSCEAMKRGIPAFGCEVGGAGGCLQVDVDRYQQAILNVLRLSGILSGSPQPAPVYESFLSGDWQLASTAGFVDTSVELGQSVCSGDHVATIRDEFGQAREVMNAPHDGIIMGVRHLRSVQAGDWATCVVEELPLR